MTRLLQLSGAALLVAFAIPACGQLVPQNLTTTNVQRMTPFLRQLRDTKRTRPLTVVILGDSMSDSYRSVGYVLVTRLNEEFGLAGHAFGGMDDTPWIGMTNGTVDVPPANSSGQFWFADYFMLPASAALWWYRNGHPEGISSDSLGVYYVATTNGGPMAVSVSTNGGPWGVVTNIDGYSANPEGDGRHLLFRLPAGFYMLRVDSLGSTNIVVGPDIYDSRSTGIRSAFMSYGGIALAQITNVPISIRFPFLRALAPDFILWHMKEDGTTNTWRGLVDFEHWIAHAAPACKVVYVGTPYIALDTNIDPRLDVTVAQNNLVRSFAIDHRRTYVDLMNPSVSWIWMTNQGYMQILPDGTTDGVHENLQGNTYLEAFLWNDLGFFTVEPQKLPLTLTVYGAGTVTPDLNGQSLQLGRRYTVTAVPAAGNLFSNWTGSVTSSVAKLTFVMVSNMVLNATFATNLFPPVQGTYTGLILATNQLYTRSGYLSLKLASSGGLSGQFIIGGVTYPVKAQVSPVGQVEIALSGGTPKQQVMTADLQFDLRGGSGQANGSLSDAQVVNGVSQPATWVSEVSGDLMGFFTKTNPAPQAGPYTLSFTGGDGVSEPAGFGYATVKVNTLGKVRMSGFLAEGTSIGQSAGISKDGRWPLYAKLSQAGNVSLLGWMTFTNLAGSNIVGQVVWTKLPKTSATYYPAGFVESMLAVGSRYVAPTNSANGILSFSSGFFGFSNGGLTPSIFNNITLSWDGKVTNTSPNALSGSINKMTGVFSGKVTVPGTSTNLTFKGAVLQGANIGYGYFLNSPQSGLVILTQ